MRDKILQLLTEWSVPPVPCVPGGISPRKDNAFKMGQGGTPLNEQGVPHVSSATTEHTEHVGQNEVFHEKNSSFIAGTSGTAGTPTLNQDELDDLEERAAIIQFDARDEK